MAIGTRQSYLLVDPTTQPVVPVFIAAPRLGDLANKRVGVIDDSKENAKELLEELVAVLRERFGVADVQYHRKPSASKPAAAEVIEYMAQACDYAIVAIGS
jgi:nucleotide-binding universal stress UspA family protein